MPNFEVWNFISSFSKGKNAAFLTSSGGKWVLQNLQWACCGWYWGRTPWGMQRSSIPMRSQLELKPKLPFTAFESSFKSEHDRWARTAWLSGAFGWGHWLTTASFLPQRGPCCSVQHLPCVCRHVAAAAGFMKKCTFLVTSVSNVLLSIS